MNMEAPRPNCILCHGDRIECFLDLGVTPLANKFITEEGLASPEPEFPLRVSFCHDCQHVQLPDRVPPSAMFEDYLYISSASDTLTAHLQDLSDIVTDRLHLSADDLAIDVGCNDGTLLSGFQRHGVRTLGVDPAKNLDHFGADIGIERYVGFFGSASAEEIVEKYGHASVVTATNTFPHIPELQDFVQGLRTVLTRDGAFVLEAHYLTDILDQVAFDTVYHEHVSYWALGPMIRLFDENEMEVVDVERIPLHHGQLRVFVKRRGEGQVQPSVAALLAQERELRLDKFETFQEFAERVDTIKRDLTQAVADLKAAGKSVVGYGAPAKGNTLLCFLGIGPDQLDYIADRSPLKQGLFTPGMHIPVVAPERLLADQPDYVLILAWNFVDEITEQLASYREAGGQFILPVPEVQIF